VTNLILWNLAQASWIIKLSLDVSTINSEISHVTHVYMYCLILLVLSIPYLSESWNHISPMSFSCCAFHF